MGSRRKQTRRSISVKGITYQRFKDYCEAQNPPKSLSGYIEDIVRDDLDKKGVPVPKALKEVPRAKKKDFEDDPPWGNHFTF